MCYGGPGRWKISSTDSPDGSSSLSDHSLSRNPGYENPNIFLFSVILGMKIRIFFSFA